jgi:pimeloyl-ACP methyl ester carboxylesterase/putative hemolysin
MLVLPVVLLAIAVLTACSKADNTAEAGLPNPAAVYCQEQGHRHEIRTDADGSQYGVCILADGTACDEWAYYRGECGPGAVEAVEPTATAEPEPAPAAVATFEEAPCPFKLPAGQVEGETIECGYLTVPENRADPEGREVRLAVAILRHPEGASEPDPIIYLEGGPGGSPLEMRMANIDAYFEPVFDARRDIIVFDQRGVGYSEPALDCPAFTGLYLDLLDYEVEGERLTSQGVLDRKVESFLACAEGLRAIADLSAYNTAASAADVNDLRLALGYEKVNLWGGSYGTRLALGVMRDFPEGLRSVVLDAPYGPEVDLYRATPGSFDRALTVLVEECAADEACDAAYPNLRAVLFETVERLDANPVTVEVIDPMTGERHEKLLDGAGLVELVFRSLYDTSMRPVLPQAIYAAREGTFAAFLPTAMLDMLRQEFRSWGMYFSVLCHEEIPFSAREGFEAAVAEYPKFAGFFGGFEVGGLAYAVCPGWGAGRADARENEPVRSEVPALIMTGEYDPIVPPGWGQSAAGTLTNSTFFEYPGMGHGVSLGDCPHSMMLAFLDDPSVAPDDACMAQMAVAPFVVPVQAADIVLEPFSSQELGISGVLPAGWSQVQPGIFARGNPAVDMAVLQLAVEPTAGPEELLAAIAKGYGLDGTPESTAERQANGLTWSLYALKVQGVPRDLALAESEAGTLVVVLRSATDERDALYSAVLMPVVDALAPLE